MTVQFGVVIVADRVRHAAAAEAVRLAGGETLATLGWDETDRLPALLAEAPVMLIEAEGAAEARLDAALPVLADAVEAYGLHAIVTLDPPQIDMIAATLMMSGVELLCAPTLGRQVTALAVAGQLAGTFRLTDRVREEEDERERQISAEAARIVALLTRFSDDERGGTGGGALGDRRQTFAIEPVSAAVDPQTVRAAIRARRMRDAFFGDGLFEDPAWDMLLDLYAAHLEGRRVSVSSLCIAAAVAPTTALRWIGRLTEAGLLRREPDHTDRRRAFLALSVRALAGMEGYAAALRRANLAFA